MISGPGVFRPYEFARGWVQDLGTRKTGGNIMVRRFGEMIKIKPEGLEQYKAYHANPLPGVNEMIKACHLKNYSIYQRGDYMFSYYEYDGDDFEADMAKMAADPATQHWWSLVKPLMEPLEDRKEGEFWSGMEEIYHLD